MVNKLKLSAIVFLCSFFIFIPALSLQFTNWDDDKFIIHNPDIRSLSLKSISKMFSSFYEGGYQPLTQLSFALDFSLWGLHPFGYHFTNVFLHSLNAVLIFNIFLLCDIPLIIAGIAVAFWSLHPMRVESVAWVSERKDVLFAFFYLSAIVLYLKGRIKLSFCIFILACLAKHQAAMLGALLPLLDWVKSKEKNFNRTSWTVVISFLLAGLALLMVTVLHAKGAWDNTAMFTLGDKIFLGCFAVFNYALKTLIPTHLSALYPYPAKINGLFPWFIYVMPWMLVSVIAFVWFNRYRWPILFFSIYFFLIHLILPLSTIATGGMFINDRYTYIPTMGLWLCFAWIIAHHFNRNKRLITWMMVIVMMGVYIMITNQTIRVWQDGVSLWSQVIRIYPHFSRSYENRGKAYLLKGDTDHALLDFSTAIRLDPSFASAYNNRAILYDQQKKADLALHDFNQALIQVPSFGAGYYNRGVFFYSQGRSVDAFHDLKKARMLGVKVSDDFYNMVDSATKIYN